MLIPRVTSEMISRTPDQVAFILNQVIDTVNELKEKNNG